MGAVCRTLKQKLFQEFHLESLEKRKLFFLKIFNNSSPAYLFRIIPLGKSSYVTRNTDAIPLFSTSAKTRFSHLLLNGTISRKNLKIVKVKGYPFMKFTNLLGHLETAFKISLVQDLLLYSTQV